MKQIVFCVLLLCLISVALATKGVYFCADSSGSECSRNPGRSTTAAAVVQSAEQTAAATLAEDEEEVVLEFDEAISTQSAETQGTTCRSYCPWLGYVININIITILT